MSPKGHPLYIAADGFATGVPSTSERSAAVEWLRYCMVPTGDTHHIAAVAAAHAATIAAANTIDHNTIVPIAAAAAAAAATDDDDNDTDGENH